MSAERREIPDEVCGEPMPVLVSQIPKSCTLPKNHDVHRCRGTAWSTDWDAWRAEIEQEVRAKVAEAIEAECIDPEWPNDEVSANGARAAAIARGDAG